MSSRESYRNRRKTKNAVQVKVPSGETFTIRSLNEYQMSKDSGCLPMLGAGKAPEKMTQEEREDVRRSYFQTLTSCVLSPRIVTEEDPSEPDSIPLSELDDEDGAVLYREILTLSGLIGREAEEARAFRDERGAVRPAARDGEGHGGTPVDADANRVAAPGVDLRPHGVGEGEGVALGAV